jgi:hypothetical protein
MGLTSDAAPGLTVGTMLAAPPRRSVARRLFLAVVFLAGLWVLAVAVAGPARAATGDPVPTTPPATSDPVAGNLAPGDLVAAAKQIVRALTSADVAATDPGTDMTAPPDGTAPADGTTGVPGSDQPLPAQDAPGDPSVDAPGTGLPTLPDGSTPPAAEPPASDPAPAAEEPADETSPAEETPAEGTPAVEAPAEEAPAIEETPAAEETAASEATPVPEETPAPETPLPEVVSSEPVDVTGEVLEQVATAVVPEPAPEPAPATAEDDPIEPAVAGCSDTAGLVATAAVAPLPSSAAPVVAPVLDSTPGSATATPAQRPQPLGSPAPPAPSGLPVPPAPTAPCGSTTALTASASSCGSGHGDRHTLLTAVLAAGLPASLAQAAFGYAGGPDGSTVPGDDAPGDRPD